MADPESPVPKQELARLEAIRRLAMGAAHNLNNAFTAVIGEASFLREDRKEDGLVVEACDVILQALQRCTRITRALLAWRSPSQSAAEEVELVRLLREMRAVLGETLGSRCALTLELPDDVLLVRASPQSLELLLICLLHYAADHSGGQADLILSGSSDADEVLLGIEVTAPQLSEETVEAILDPSLAGDPVTRVTLEATREILDLMGGSLHAARSSPEQWALRLRLPAVRGHGDADGQGG